MTETPPASSLTFANAASSLQGRLVLRKGLLHLLQTWKYAAGLLVLLMVIRLLGQGWAGATVGFIALGLWVLGCFGWAWYKRPAPYAAFSYWDRQAPAVMRLRMAGGSRGNRNSQRGSACMWSATAASCRRRWGSWGVTSRCQTFAGCHSCPWRRWP